MYYVEGITKRLSLEMPNFERDTGHEDNNVSAAAGEKFDGALRIVTSPFNLEDRSPSAMYRLMACSAPLAGKLIKALSNVGWSRSALNPTFVPPTSRPIDLVDMSMHNVHGMVMELEQNAHRISLVLMQGLEFVKEDVNALRDWTDPHQTDVSECFHSAHSVQQAAATFYAAHAALTAQTLRAKTSFNSIMIGKGMIHHGADSDHLDKDELGGTGVLMPRDREDHYGVAAQADVMDIADNAFPKGTQAFAHPRIAEGVDQLCSIIKKTYVELITCAFEVRDRSKHMLSVIQGPHGAIFRNMRDHSMISQLTRWTKSVNAAFVSFEPIDTILVDADMTADWEASIENQWRELPALYDEYRMLTPQERVRSTLRSLRLPPIQLLCNLKLSYDFRNQTYMRSLLTHADMQVYRDNLWRLSSSATCFVAHDSDVPRVSIEASNNVDPAVKCARLMTRPNGLFLHNAFNEDAVQALMLRLELPEIMRLMFSSRVFYMLCSKYKDFWNRLSNLMLIQHNGKLAWINGQQMVNNIKFRSDDLPRFDGDVFNYHYQSFYQLQATLSINYSAYPGGKTFCVYCLSESCFRSKLFNGQVICTNCYGKHTVTATELWKLQQRDNKKKFKEYEERQWFSHASVLRTRCVWELAHRPMRGNPAKHDIVFNTVEATNIMKEFEHKANALSPQLTVPDLRPRLQDTDVRHLLGGANAQLREPQKVKLCANFVKYSARQYGVNRVQLTNGFDHATIQRFIGDYSVPRKPDFTYHMYGPEAKKITVTVSMPDGDGVDVDLTDPIDHIPFYNKKPVPGQGCVYRVNRPFKVMAQQQPEKICGVVSMGKVFNEESLCEMCYCRAYAEGVDAMLNETDDDEFE